jgi:hypothetical protein
MAAQSVPISSARASSRFRAVCNGPFVAASGITAFIHITSNQKGPRTPFALALVNTIIPTARRFAMLHLADRNIHDRKQWKYHGIRIVVRLRVDQYRANTGHEPGRRHHAGALWRRETEPAPVILPKRKPSPPPWAGRERTTS